MTSYHSLTLRGTITECTPADPPACTKVVYQKVAPGKGNLPGTGDYAYQRRRHVIPADPRTPAQVARRATFAAAVTEWQAMTDDQRRAWRAAAAGLAISGYNLYISHRTR